MNKAELVNALADRLGGNKKAAGDALEAVIDTVYRAVSKGEKVTITGFGSFEKVQRAARTGRNPATGQTIKVKKSVAPKFRPGQEFKNVISGAKKLPRLAAAKSAAAPAPARATATAKKAPAKAAATRSRRQEGTARPRRQPGRRRRRQRSPWQPRRSQRSRSRFPARWRSRGRPRPSRRRSHQGCAGEEGGGEEGNHEAGCSEALIRTDTSDGPDPHGSGPSSCSGIRPSRAGGSSAQREGDDRERGDRLVVAAAVDLEPHPLPEPQRPQARPAKATGAERQSEPVVEQH